MTSDDPSDTSDTSDTSDASDQDDEEPLLRSVALQNASTILAARHKAEQELLAAKEQLAASNARITKILESITDGFAVVDDGWRVSYLNQRASELLAPFRTRDAADASLGQSLWQAFPGFRGTALDVELRRAVTKQTAVQFELHEPTSDRWLDIRAYPSTGALTTYFHDITRRKHDEQALREEARTLELINKTGKAVASTLDLQALVQLVTDAGTELTGAKFGAFFYSVTNNDGETFQLYTLSGAPREAFARFGHPRATPIFAPTFRGEGVIRSDDVTADPRYGQMPPHKGMPAGHLPVRSYLAVSVRARSGDVIGGLFFGHPDAGVFNERSERLIVAVAAQAGVAMDNARLYEAAQQSAAERKRLLESESAARTEAEHANRMKDEFLSVLSHELRTPLTAILGWANMLRGRVTDPDHMRGLTIIERNARMQSQLIDDLLDMSRITSGKLRLDVQPLPPASFIENAIETVRPAADAKGIRIERLLDSSAGPVHGDSNRLQQVLWNLLSNAIKFTPRGGKVQVVLERVSSHVEITVADTGPGIPAEFLPHVFERFRQEDSSTTRKHGGLGLGLSIVKHLVELHGGTVQAHTGGEGKGASFVVCLPVAVVHRQGGVARVHPTSNNVDIVPASDLADLADLTGLTIVVVDDEEDARELIRDILAHCGARVLAAHNAAEAVAFVERERPDVLVSDIGMPEVDGYELIKRVRALGPEKNGRVPAIALTAFARTEDRLRALRAGYLVHVAKPVEPAELVATVASIAGRAIGS